MSTYPSGYRFNPTDEELIKNYLLPRIFNNSLPAVDIPTVALNKYSPETLIKEFKDTERFMENELIVFTNRLQKHSKGRRANRSTARGFWKPTGSDKEITDGKGRTIGRRTHLDYYEGIQGGSCGKRTPWKMHEYCYYSNNDKNKGKFQELVLCKIYLNSRHKNNENVNNENMGVSETTNVDDSNQTMEEKTTEVGYVQSGNNNMVIIQNPMNTSNGHGLLDLSSTEGANPSGNNFLGNQSSQTWSSEYPDIDFHMNNYARILQSNEPVIRFPPLMDISPILGCPISYNVATDHDQNYKTWER